MLKVFDAENGFRLLQSLVIHEGKQIDNHSTLEIMHDRAYVFYNTPELRIHGKMLRWE